MPSLHGAGSSPGPAAPQPSSPQVQQPPLAPRKRPGRTVYAQMHNEKEQEMTSPVSHGEDVHGAGQGERWLTAPGPRQCSLPDTWA